MTRVTPSVLLLVVLAGGTASAEDNGARLFAGHCAACHGREGRGDGPAAPDLDPRPRDLTTSQFRFRTSASGERPRVGDIERTIRHGLPGTAMPAFGRLFSTAELRELAIFVAALSGGGEPEAVPLAPLEDGEPPAGRALYLLLGCSSCHGVAGNGRGLAARALVDENGRRIRATDFRHDPLKGGRRPEDVVRTLRTGLNGAPMPSYDAALLLGADDAAPPEGLDADDVERVEAFLHEEPTRAKLDAMTPEERERLRDRRAAALARYVLSLRPERSFWFRLFRQEPEREPRAAAEVGE